MSSTTYAHPPRTKPVRTHWPVDDKRGIYGMYTVIATELALFVCMFASYYFLGGDKYRWAIDRPPKLHYALIMLGVVILSGFVLFWGERQVRLERLGAARLAILATLLLGIVFLVLQWFDYSEHSRTLAPYSDSYGSIFYAITGLDTAHVILGVLLLAYAAVLPRYGPTLLPPYRPYRVVALYWYFVVLVWIAIVALLYVIPNIQVYSH